jgi:hypothetical protein
LNPRPLGYEPNELPDCSTPRQGQTEHPEPPIRTQRLQTRKTKIRNSLVGLGRVELPTSRLSGVRSNQLSYRPQVFCASNNSREFCRKKEPHCSTVRSVGNGGRYRGACSFGGYKLPAIYFLQIMKDLLTKFEISDLRSQRNRFLKTR